jgi:hypothetical protein
VQVKLSVVCTEDGQQVKRFIVDGPRIDKRKSYRVAFV